MRRSVYLCSNLSMRNRALAAWMTSNKLSLIPLTADEAGLSSQKIARDPLTTRVLPFMLNSTPVS
jgi:hypothetical protein